MNHATSLGIKARPLDFYVAFLIFFMGFYGFIDPTWPERYNVGSMVYWIIMIEDIYLVVAGFVIMSALIIKQTKWGNSPKVTVCTLVFEMFAWLFTASAATVIAISTPWLPPSAFAAAEGPLLWSWAILWLGLAISAFMRYWDIHSLSRGKK